ncbi:SEC14 cytosolic factor-like isoform X2 [Solanum tuberosum]|uniref:SEC14 cytosolic factor / phosphoglyceride transfer family protein n=1 Tax=Solanum tuberosum TaxID=4113 RepID=M1C345_SOLTU|nr:PREDICTED: SEC14 cytosolic factor-like isoform X1 [Solanum tuberosum]XP_006364047.1 PREDICTED: SEC14 cytosolic factor-like isoform X2 [Solanum tuberosum]
MDRNQEIALAKMRKSVEKPGSSTESYGEKTLMRFLIARSMNPEKAAKMFCQWKKWRAEMVPTGYITDSEVADESAAEKVYLQGLSKNGYPVAIIKLNKHFASKDQVQFKKFVVHALDKTIASSFNGREIGNEKLIAILDLQNITYSNVDTRGLITGFQFLQAYYPERLATCYLLHMPQFFVTVWRFICRFLDKATQRKMRIVMSEEQKQEFIREVGEDVLPEEYGGRAKLVLLQDVAVNY